MNREPLMFEATALSMEPPPLPSEKNVRLRKAITNVVFFLGSGSKRGKITPHYQGVMGSNPYGGFFLLVLLRQLIRA